MQKAIIAIDQGTSSSRAVLFDLDFSIIHIEQININTTSNKRATVLSIRSFTIRISFTICAPILGYIAESYSLANSFYVLAIVIGVFSLLASFKLYNLD